jgi:hypothetical protein
MRMIGCHRMPGVALRNVVTRLKPQGPQSEEPAKEMVMHRSSEQVEMRPNRLTNTSFLGFCLHFLSHFIFGQQWRKEIYAYIFQECRIVSASQGAAFIPALIETL